jgi:hypothetical protein
MGFERFPKVRWDDGVLLDTILYMNTLGALVDRRMLSYQTSLEALGFDYPNELRNMEEEKPLVEDGTFGILGSPWQQAKMSGLPDTKQGVPEGTPSSGPPKGTQKQKDLTPKTTKKSDVSPNQQKKNLQVKKAASLDIKDMTAKQYASFLDGAKSTLDTDDYAEFVDYYGNLRYGK